MEYQKCVVCENQIPSFFFDSAGEEHVVFACATAYFLRLIVENTQFWTKI